MRLSGTLPCPRHTELVTWLMSEHRPGYGHAIALVPRPRLFLGSLLSSGGMWQAGRSRAA
ncbi:DUF4287 domain-containing protein [Streptomyces tubercidicus]|uniref:DUF4287 domain-containing protein n=1 Tax=Streptomyces tubercidicus TaxID=47759 RepID=UPI0035307682